MFRFLNRIPIFGLLAFTATSGSFAATAPLHIVLDPGHGGSDEGTTFDSTQAHIAEKDITLAIATETARALKSEGYRVTLTRSDDEAVDLAKRTALANQLKADLFISIHVNSEPPGPGQKAQGVETFVLNHSTNASSKRLAELENSFFAKPSPDEGALPLILKDLKLEAKTPQSLGLACSIQTELLKTTSPPQTRAKRDRGVRQALFHVLLGAEMPSVLVEIGFLTSQKDRSLFFSRPGQKQIAQGLTEGVSRYFAHPSPSTQLSTCRVF